MTDTPSVTGEVRMLIDGQLVEADSGKRFDNVSPVTEERDAARGVRSYAHSERLVVAADPSDPSRDGYFGERSSV